MITEAPKILVLNF